jgi:homoserine O-acetyltransferase/O-succinyltransferase
MMGGIVGLSCQPIEISGRNRILRRAAAEAIRHDPDWNNGNYEKNPTHYIYSTTAGSFMPESGARAQEMAPTRAAADELYDERVARIAKGDANDSLWAIESIEDYSPESDLPSLQPARTPLALWYTSEKRPQGRRALFRVEAPKGPAARALADRAP